jgi:hypothetical protein
MKVKLPSLGRNNRRSRTDAAGGHGWLAGKIKGWHPAQSNK